MSQGRAQDEGRGSQEGGKEARGDGGIEARLKLPVQSAKNQDDQGKCSVSQLSPDGTLGNRPWKVFTNFFFFLFYLELQIYVYFRMSSQGAERGDQTSTSQQPSTRRSRGRKPGAEINEEIV